MDKSRILIVDDEAPMRRYLVRLLSPLNHDLVVAEDGVSGLEAARAAPMDLVISDLKMPRMDGLTFLENLRREGNDAAFILLTAYSDLSTVLAARDRFNIANFLVKPIHNQDQFLFDVDAAITRRHLEMQNRELMQALTRANAELEDKVQARTQELTDKNVELAKLSQFRGEVLRVLSHELRTPLAIMGGYLGLQGNGLEEGRPKHSKMMTAALGRVQRIVDKSIQQIRESEITRFDLDLEPVDPGRLCEEVAERLNLLLAPREVGIEVLAEAVGDCRWDRSRVESIIEELLTNAARASKDKSAIRLTVADEGPSVVIAVVDQGRGIARKDLQRIFEPFVTLGRVDRHTSGMFGYRAQGVGLGLSIAKTLAELQHGELEAQPNRDGNGTTFRLRLPKQIQPE